MAKKSSGSIGNPQVGRPGSVTGVGTVGAAGWSGPLYRSPHIAPPSTYAPPPVRTSGGLRSRVSNQVRQSVGRTQLPAPTYSVSAGYVPYNTPIGGMNYGQLTAGQVGTMNPNTYIGGMTYGQLTQGQAQAPVVGAPQVDPYMQQAINAALTRSRTAAGTLPNYMGLANQLQNGVVVDSPEVRRTIDALLTEQGSAPIGGYDVQPGQVNSTSFYRPDGSYDWGAHNAARAAGLAVI